jgi:hypothetical protein
MTVEQQGEAISSLAADQGRLARGECRSACEKRGGFVGSDAKPVVVTKGVAIARRIARLAGS